MSGPAKKVGGYAPGAPAFGQGAVHGALGRETRLAAGKRVLVFGGSFDPPHTGHMALLRGAIEAVRAQRVLVIPSGTAPHKQASGTPGPLREAMCECFRAVFAGLEISDIELRRPGKSYTFDTLTELKAIWPDDDFYLCLGTDMLRSFMGWHRAEELLRLVTLVVHARGQQERAELLKAAAELESKGGRVLLAGGPVVPVSSSGLRQALSQGQDVWAYIPPPADEIIRRNHLYRAQPEGL